MALANTPILESTRHDVYPFIDPTSDLAGSQAGRIVMVTGSGTGIGRTIAQAFAQAGATQVILVARRLQPLDETKSLIVQESPSCDVVVRGGIDISQSEAIEKLFASLTNVPDVLIHNAGVSDLTDTLCDADPAVWFGEIDINIKGTFLLCRAFLRSLKSQGRTFGRIINLSSNVFWHNVPGRSSYAASKIAVNSLTEYIDNECLEDPDLNNVRCVALHPGGVAGTQLSSKVPPEILKLLIDKPALAAGTSVYLSTEASTFLMGRFIMATWDMEELKKKEDQIKSSDWLRTRVLGAM